MSQFTLYLIFAAIAAGVGGLLWWWRLLTIREVALMEATPLSRASDIAALTPGTVVEASGKLECDAPIEAEFSLKPCVYFDCNITREERQYGTDSNGNQRTDTRTVTVHSNQRYVPCRLRDDSGAVALDLTSAHVEAVQEMNRLGPPDTIKSGGLFATLSNAGNRYIENLLTPGMTVFVLGVVMPGGGIGAPEAGAANRTFVVGYKSKAERSRSMAWRIRLLAAGVFICAVLTLLALAFAFASNRI